jgi:uncharacterized protein (TIGR04255 family)
MPFKETQRVIYNKNPLIQVVSQLRFPRILAIDEKQPVDFQEKIRQEYPLFEESIVQSHNVFFDPIQQKLQNSTSADSVKNYVFTTENKEAKGQFSRYIFVFCYFALYYTLLGSYLIFLEGLEF